MVDSINDTVDENFNYDVENVKLQKHEVNSTDSSVISDLSSLKLGSSVIGIFGYSFKGPEKFESISKAEILNTEIFYFVDRYYRSSYGARKASKNVKRSSVGHIAGFNDMSKFPIKFKHSSLEDLYALNLNDWMMKRMPFISALFLIITLLLWPLTVKGFKKTGAWSNEPYILVMFHVIMAITVVLIFLPFLCFFSRFNRLTEKICYYSLGLVSFLWACWQLVGSYSLMVNYSNYSIYELIIIREALKGVTYIYGILPIVALDSILPTRSSRTWWIHFQFIFFYSLSTITRSFVNSYIPWAHVMLMISFYLSMISLLYFGSFNSEVQTRISFYNWLVNTKKIAKLEMDINGLKGSNKFSTPAEVVLANVKKCLRIARYIDEAFRDRIPEISDSMGQLYKTMVNCKEQLTKNPNLYSVPDTQFKNLGQEADILRSYVSRYYHQKNANKAPSVDNRTSRTQKTETQGQISDTRFYQYLGSSAKVVSKVNLFQLLNDWNFDIFAWFRDESEPFVSLAHCMLSEFEKHYSLPNHVVLNFLSVVQGLYKNVAYHNSMHAIFVAQKVCCLANYIGIYNAMSVLDRAILVVASLCHDIGHPGKTNSFFINCQHEVAMLFNDKSVLENYHCCVTFNILKLADCNIFRALDHVEMRRVRRRIIELILATDMEDHFETITQFRLRRVAHDFSIDNDLNMISKMLIKTADIGSACVSWDQSYEWAQRIFLEFYSQGDLENTLGMPVSALCDSNRHRELPKAQSGFLLYVASPLFEELSKIPSSIKCLGHDHNPASLSELDDSHSLFSLTDCNSQHDLYDSVHDSLPDLSCNQEPAIYAGDTSPVSSDHDYHDSTDAEDYHKPRDYGACPRQSIPNRVHSVCLVQLKHNAERWEQLAELGQTVNLVEFPHEDVQLDMGLAINLT